MHKTCKIMNSTCDMLIHKLLSLTSSSSNLSHAFSSSVSSFCLWFASSLFSVVFNICHIARILSELSFFWIYARRMQTVMRLSHSNHLVNLRLIASSRVLEFELNIRPEKCRVELEFFWKSVESNWEVEFENLSRIEKLDSTTRPENSIRFDKILDKCK